MAIDYIDAYTQPAQARFYIDGKHTSDDGEVFFIKNNRFHRIEGPARYMIDGRCLHYINGTNVTSEIEDMYANDAIHWVDESNHNCPDLDVLDDTSRFTVELALGGTPQGKPASKIHDSEFDMQEMMHKHEFEKWFQEELNKGKSWKEVNDSLQM